ncbi:MAG: hypothetical protein PF518_19185 [Spirochaetaceae bacterium]|jgi:hypothetical protein|nr:hypothetical protein [Spirochaetaceae bacterium]
MKKILSLLFLIIAADLSASTIIINSIYDDDVSPGSISAAASVEDGLMEALFDFGFIMFSTSNAESHSISGAKDARFMISIKPLLDRKAVEYKLQATVNGLVIDSGIVNLSTINVDSNVKESRIYYLIGEEVAAKLIQFF